MPALSRHPGWGNAKSRGKKLKKKHCGQMITEHRWPVTCSYLTLRRNENKFFFLKRTLSSQEHATPPGPFPDRTDRSLETSARRPRVFKSWIRVLLSQAWTSLLRIAMRILRYLLNGISRRKTICPDSLHQTSFKRCLNALDLSGIGKQHYIVSVEHSL